LRLLVRVDQLVPEARGSVRELLQQTLGAGFVRRPPREESVNVDVAVKAVQYGDRLIGQAVSFVPREVVRQGVSGG